MGEINKWLFKCVYWIMKKPNIKTLKQFTKLKKTIYNRHYILRNKIYWFLNVSNECQLFKQIS